MDKLKILIISNLYPPQVIGGYERQIADFARILNSRGHEVLVLTSNTEDYTSNSTYNNPEPEIKRCFHLCGAWTKQGPQEFAFEQVAVRTLINREILASELQTFQPDICLAGNIDFFRVELLEKILADDIPIVHFLMNSAPGYIAELAPKSRLYQFVTCSNWIREGLKQQGYPAQTAQTIYLGAPVEEFYQAELPPRDKLHIVYASLLMPYKGADVLIEALTLLQVEGMEFTATFAGGTLIPEFVDELKEFVKSEGLEEQVKFTGVLSRQELKQLYRTQNVLVLPSRFQEPFSISLIEAMSAGLTIIASNTGGSPEAVEHGKSGLIFESENPLDLADNLYYLVNHPNEWEMMTKNGQQRALSKFSLKHTVDQLEEALFKQVNLSQYLTLK
ncbi:glycosyltransferase family 4 protein [Anabaena cylindrica UHCC 0172]|uniref:glycosyltransferase family 4 protein n=1 Tax=Anabaena cylindrica TaxID=1165 RepID=UPI002B1EE748|nr:glycosyltransferase family 4 protein [Anabaena cylindrica]MEA5549896.1 glycosyltransferase family 4 protein [Anabaena cylindrica UHCC 0172]